MQFCNQLTRKVIKINTTATRKNKRETISKTCKKYRLLIIAIIESQRNNPDNLFEVDEKSRCYTPIHSKDEEKLNYKTKSLKLFVTRQCFPKKPLACPPRFAKQKKKKLRTEQQF